MDKHLHIVTHDVPWPVDYGGVTDLFYKIKALHSLGIKIHLHSFTGDRPVQLILDKYCESVDYYPRKKGLEGFSLRIPYIVQSRSDVALLKNLEQDKHPILLEGIHCTYFLQKGKLKGRKVFVRLHNVEYNYYRQLAKYETNILRKTYFRLESRLLEKYERKLAPTTTFWAVSLADASLYKNELHASQVHFVPVFLPWETASGKPGKGTFCLYHGNLSVNENEQAAGWLINEVFNDLNIQLVIAGKSPSPHLKDLAEKYANITIHADPSESAMQELIQKAHINIIPSFNNTGVKLKLLNALYNGRFCIANRQAAAGSGLENECSIAESPGTFKTTIIQLIEEAFTEEKMQHRDAALKELYKNEKNAMKLIAWIY